MDAERARQCRAPTTYSLQEAPRTDRKTGLAWRGLLVVLILVSLAAGRILLLVDIRFLLRRELSAVCLPVGPDVLIDILLVSVGLGSFRRRHLPAANTVGDPLLLDVSPGAHLIVSVLIGRGVMFVVVDRPTQIILLAVHFLALLGRQRAAVCGAVGVNLLVQ